MFNIIFIAMGVYFIWDAWVELKETYVGSNCPLEVGRLLELLLGVLMIIGILVRVLG